MPTVNIYYVEIEYTMRMSVAVTAPSTTAAKRRAKKMIEDGDLDYDGDVVEDSEKVVGCELSEGG